MKKIIAMLVFVLLLSTTVLAGEISFGQTNGRFRMRMRDRSSDIYYRNGRRSNYFSYKWKEKRPTRMCRQTKKNNYCSDIEAEQYNGKKDNFVFRSGYALLRLNQKEWMTDKPFVGQRWVGVTGPNTGAIYKVVAGKGNVLILKKENAYKSVQDENVVFMMLLHREHQPIH